MDQREINERAWRTKANWRFGVYKSQLDTRVWVPKPSKWMGWTLNFGNRIAYLWLFLLFLPAFFVVGVVSLLSR